MKNVIRYNDSDIEFYGSFTVEEDVLPYTCAIEEKRFDEIVRPDGEKFWHQKQCQAKIIEIYRREYTIPDEVLRDSYYSYRTMKLYFRVLCIIEIEQEEKDYIYSAHQISCCSYHQVDEEYKEIE
jgi:hypothetical protein